MKHRKTRAQMAKARQAKRENLALDAVANPYDLAFGEMRESLRLQYLEGLRSLGDVSKGVLSRVAFPFWAAPAFFKSTREEVKGLSQEELGDACGLARSIIAKYEAGSVLPTIDNAHAIYEALNKLGSAKAISALIDIQDILLYARAQVLQMREQLHEQSAKDIQKLKAEYAIEQANRNRLFEEKISTEATRKDS